MGSKNNKTALGAVKASLPQNDGFLEKAERKVQLKLSQRFYVFKELSPNLKIPMAKMGLAQTTAELLSLKRWVEGQAENQLSVFVNLKVWEVLAKARAKTTKLDSVMKAMGSVLGSSAFKKLKSTTTVASKYKNLGAPVVKRKEKEPEFDTFNTLASYNNPFAIFDAPKISGIWQDDKFFATQRLAGLNPMAVKRVTLKASEPGIGAPWSVLKAKLSKSINKSALDHFGLNISFDQAVKQRRLFVCDYEALAAVTPDPAAPGVKLNKLLAPIALFVHTDDFPGLQLVAIQFDQKPSSTVMLAADADAPGRANNWLMAKMLVQISDVNYNQSVNHLLEAHLVQDAFALTTRRHLAEQHPMHILLSRHFTALLAINNAGEKLLLSDTGLIQQILETGLSGALQLMNNRYQTWRFEDLDFKARLELRGLDKSEDLPYFPYRDDGKLIWAALGNYAKEYIGNYYKSNADVVADYELQGWAKELNGKVAGFNDSIGSVKELLTIIQRLLWVAGPQHAAVNFPQMEYFGFVPNMPTAYYSSPPANFSRRAVTDQELLDFLPPSLKTEAQLETTVALSGYHYDSLLDYYADLEPAAGKICRKYYEQLRGDVTKKITAKNLQRQTQHGLLPYSYFLPENIPNSTSV